MLIDTLTSFAEHHAVCTTPFELLVINNNSTDSTGRVIEQFTDRYRLMRVRGIHEPLQGLSHARNRAVCEATGAIIVYCDDDVFFDTNVVDTYAEAFGTDENLVAAAGRVDPHFEAPRPLWLSDEMLRPYSITAFGDAARPLTPAEKPVGANMAIRRTSVLACGGFNPKLGRDGRSLLSNEENLLFAQLRQQGGRFVYVPQARLRHRIPAERLTEEWLLSRQYWQGVSDAVLEAEAPTHSRVDALWGAWADLRRVLRIIQPRTLDPRQWYWRVRRPGIDVGMRLAYSRGRAVARLKKALGS